MKLAVVTGAASGLGRVIADDLESIGGYEVARVGHKCYFNEDTRSNWMNKVISYYNAVPDVLINNAGIIKFGWIDEENDLKFNEFEDVLSVNVLAYYKAIAKLVFYSNVQKERQEHTIINISSIAYRVPYSRSPAYAASKAAIVAMTASLGRQFFIRFPRCRIYCLAPALLEGSKMTQQVFNDMSATGRPGPQNAVGHLQYRSDVSDTVLWLCKSRPEYLSGSTIEYPGGV